jgi:fructokinase
VAAPWPTAAREDAPVIAVVGEALVDLVVAPDASVTAALGGAPFNVARTCGRLDADVAFVGALSRDRFGEALLAQLEHDRVDIGSVVRVDAPTTLAAAEVDGRGAATYRFYLAGTSAPSLATVALPAATSAVVTGGLALVLEPLAQAVVDAVLALPGDPLVIVDVNCRPAVVSVRDEYLARIDAVLRRTDVVKVSDEDLGYLFPGDGSLDAGRVLLERGPRVVLLTAGGEGVTILTADGTTHVPVPSVDVVDTIGAGDAFVGGVVSWWRAHRLGRDALVDQGLLGEAVRAAGVVASVACTRRGADPPWREELPPRTW